MRFDPSTAECLVFTYKEGLLSPVAHDLKLRVTRFTVDVSDDLQRLEASFDPQSLRVASAMRDGREAPAVLSERDRKSIEQTIVDEVLEARRHPELRYASGSIVRRGDRALIAGTLTLHGHPRVLTVEAALADGDWTVSTRLHQPDFGIRPYSAMLGTLRIQPDVTVSLRLYTRGKPASGE
jgi:polyisoprenoid-binding protein YceI